MLLKIYSIRDAKSEVYNTPFYQKTHGEALRSFMEVSTDKQSQVSKYPEDFDLYHLGEYDDNTGQTSPLDTPQHMAKAIEHQQPKTAPKS